MQQGGWTTARIAKACSTYHNKIARALAVVAVPDVARKVERGEITASAAAEVAKLDDDTRAAVLEKMPTMESNESQVAAVKQLAKAVKAGDIDKAIQSGEELVHAGKRGPKTATALRAAWKTPRQMGEVLGYLASVFSKLDPTNADTAVQYYETRGSIATMLYLRGDLESIAIPGEDSDDPKEKRIIVRFKAMIATEAKAYDKANSATDDAEPAAADENEDESEADEG
jgi:hypothetical protein